VAFGVGTALAAGALSVAFPLVGSSASSRLRTLYLPGFVITWLLGGRAGVGVDVEQVLLFARVGTVVFYGAVGAVVGAAFRRPRWAAAACVLILSGAVGAAVGWDVQEAHQRAEYEQEQRVRYLKGALARLETHPDDLDARSLVAHYSFRYFDRPAVAEREYRTIVELEGGSPGQHSLHAHLNLAILLRRQGRAAEAEEEFLRYRELAPRIAVPEGERAMLRLLEREYEGTK
jgi:hypothetical protein